MLVITAFAILLASCDAGNNKSASGPASTSAKPTPNVETLLSGRGLNQPSAVEVRPGTDEAWVTNYGDDSVTIVSLSGRDPKVIRQAQDAFAEHFVARPSGLSFDESGRYLAVSNDSNNELRDMDFKINPERNIYFKGSNFMGPTLFASDTFALAGQSKKYLADWPQPGYGHDPKDNVSQNECPPQYWSSEVNLCKWPREGSHVDMLHESPLSAGIVNERKNIYWVLDGCGTRDAANKCRADGHVVMYDFNRDHQEGNGFHGDGVVRRFPTATFTRVEGVSSGMLVHDGWLYYSDTGKGAIRRVNLASGTAQVMVAPWFDRPATHDAQGPGTIDWSYVPNSPGDGDTPPVIKDWITGRGDAASISAAGDRWIKPQEVLAEYSYVAGSIVEEIGAGTVTRPAGMTAGPDGFFVADAANGTIREYSWDGSAKRVFETGRKSLSGLTYRSGALIFTDRTGNSLFRLPLA